MAKYVSEAAAMMAAAMATYQTETRALNARMAQGEFRGQGADYLAELAAAKTRRDMVYVQARRLHSAQKRVAA